MEFRSRILNKVKITIDNEDNKYRFEAILTLLFTVIFITFFFLPTIHNIKQKQVKNTELKQEKLQVEELLENYKRAALNYEKMEPYEDSMLSLVPFSVDPVSTIEKIDRFRKQNNVHLGSTTLVEKNSQEETYNVSLGGSYANIVNFFEDLKNDSRFFKVSSLSINNSEDINEDSLIIQVQISSFFYEK